MRTLILFLLALTMVFSSCNIGGKGKKSSQESTESSSADEGEPGNAADAMKKAMEALGGNGETAEPVNHRDLKELLKERMRGYDRTDYSSQSVGSFGINISSAEGTYEDGDKRINVTITDTGGLGMAMMSMAAWSSMHLDKEDSHGWERTGTYKGFKSYEKYDKSSNYSEIALIVENRFVVALNGSNCDMDDLKRFADDLDLSHLKSLI